MPLCFFANLGLEEGEQDAVFWISLRTEEGVVPLIDKAAQVLVVHLYCLEVSEVKDTSVGLDNLVPVDYHDKDLSSLLPSRRLAALLLWQCRPDVLSRCSSEL